MSLLEPFVAQRVAIYTNDGRVVLGLLKGCDQMTNVILEEAVERIFSEDTGVEESELGIYMIRGDNVAVIGEIDPAADEQVDWSAILAPPLAEIHH